MFKAKDIDGLWWRFSSAPTLTGSGWLCKGHTSSLPNHKDTEEDWVESLEEIDPAIGAEAKTQ